MAKKFFFIFLLILGLMIFSPAFAQEKSYKLEINFFYSQTCPHCLAEQKFLDKIQEKYPEIKINRYLASDSNNRKILVDLLKKHDAEMYAGLVPVTFVGEDLILGFDNEKGIGKRIEDSIKRQISQPSPGPGKDNRIHLPIIGDIDLTKYSLPAQAVILGFFDGFNVCSLGALILILGLVLILRSRAKILIFGGLYILTTAVVYGLLIVLWYQLFYFLAPVLKIMDIFVGALGIIGGIYFLRQFVRYKKYGPMCDVKQNGIVAKFSNKVRNGFKESGGLWAIIVSIFIFAVVITVVEFPCSAVIPVLFASILANAKVPALIYLLYIIVYLFFYMLDEIILFLIALFTMTIKIASSKIMIWLSLVEAIFLFGLGMYYLIGVF
ncbi:MAG: glutaredoxin family protein [Patescibacteria group bacterium]